MTGLFTLFNFKSLKEKLIYVTQSPVILSKYIYIEIKERIFNKNTYLNGLRDYYYWRVNKTEYDNEKFFISQYEQYLMASDLPLNTSVLDWTYITIMLRLQTDRLDILQKHRLALIQSNIQYHPKYRESVLELYDNKIGTIKTITIRHLVNTLDSLSDSVKMKAAGINERGTERITAVEDRAAKERESYIRQLSSVEETAAKEKARYVEELTTLSDYNHTLINENLVFQHNNSELQKTNQDLETRVTSLITDIEDLQERLVSNAKTVIKIMEENQRINLENDQLEKKSSKLKDVTETIENKNTELMLALANEKRENKKLFNEQTINRAEIENQQRTDVQQKSLWDDDRKTFTNQLLLQKAELNKIKNKINAYEATLKDKDMQLHTARYDRDKYKDMNEKLTNNKIGIITELETKLTTTLNHMEEGYLTLGEDINKLVNNYVALQMLTDEMTTLQRNQDQTERHILLINKDLQEEDERHMVDGQFVDVDPKRVGNKDLIYAGHASINAQHNMRKNELNKTLMAQTTHQTTFITEMTKNATNKYNIDESTKEIIEKLRSNLTTVDKMLLEARHLLENVGNITMSIDNKNPRKLKDLSVSSEQVQITKPLSKLEKETVHKHSLPSKPTVTPQIAKALTNNNNNNAIPSQLKEAYANVLSNQTIRPALRNIIGQMQPQPVLVPIATSTSSVDNSNSSPNISNTSLLD